MAMNPRLLRPLSRFQAPAPALLLDSYGDGALAAYSLRRLSNSYTGPVVRVRRSSDSAESDFAASDVSGGALAVWVGAGNDGLVATWYDQSGQGNHATQSTSTRQPSIVLNGAVVAVSGKPAIRFPTGDGYDGRFLPLAFAAALDRIDAYLVHETDDEQYVLFAGSNSSFAFLPACQLGSEEGSSNDSGTPDFFANGTLLTDITRGGLQSSFAGRAICVISNASTTAITWGASSRFGGYSDTFDYHGYVHEILLYSANTTSVRLSIESNLNSYYAVF